MRRATLLEQTRLRRRLGLPSADFEDELVVEGYLLVEPYEDGQHLRHREPLASRGDPLFQYLQIEAFSK